MRNDEAERHDAERAGGSGPRRASSANTYEDSGMSRSPTEKRRTNVTLDASNLAAARDLDLNVSVISDAALDDAVRVARARAWSAENAEAIAERHTWIEVNGTPLADIQILETR